MVDGIEAVEVVVGQLGSDAPGGYLSELISFHSYLVIQIWRVMQGAREAVEEPGNSVDAKLRTMAECTAGDIIIQLIDHDRRGVCDVLHELSQRSWRRGIAPAKAQAANQPE